MATLATDVGIEFDANHPPSLIQAKASTGDTHFRGGLAYMAAGKIDLTPAATDLFGGVIWERKVTAAADELVWMAISGRYFFANANFTDANYGLTFALPAAALFDNPADLALAAVGTAGTAGTLDHVASTAVNGWLNIDRRSAAENL